MPKSEENYIRKASKPISKSKAQNTSKELIKTVIFPTWYIHFLMYKMVDFCYLQDGSQDMKYVLLKVRWDI